MMKLGEMMKKRFLLIIAMLLLTGCINIKNSNYDEIINETISSNVSIYNTYRNGYKFYLPKGLYVDNSVEYNEIIRNGRENYYLYIDLISYLNKKENTYEENTTSIYSNRFVSGERSGYIEINQKNDKYLVEIMYNYAKIEVMVEEENLKDSVSNAIIILSSINYNDKMLKNLNHENVLNYNEETIDIFKTNGRDNSNFLKYVEEYDTSSETAVPDYDLIN